MGDELQGFRCLIELSVRSGRSALARLLTSVNPCLFFQLCSSQTTQRDLELRLLRCEGFGFGGGLVCTSARIAQLGLGLV